MRLQILLYKSTKQSDSLLFKTFIQAGVKVTKASNISKLHILLTSQFFDAIIIDEEFLKLHCISPSKHLWDFHSQFSIISYTFSENKIITKSYKLPYKETDNEIFKRKDETSQEIEKILNSLNNTSQKYPICVNQNNEIEKKIVISELINEFPILLHKKIRIVFETILNNNADGADTRLITNKVWGITSEDRKKDIQIYICKIRNLLTLKYGKKYQILLKNKKYFFINNFIQENEFISN